MMEAVVPLGVAGSRGNLTFTEMEKEQIWIDSVHSSYELVWNAAKYRRVDGANGRKLSCVQNFGDKQFTVKDDIEQAYILLDDMQWYGMKFYL